MGPRILRSCCRCLVPVIIALVVSPFLSTMDSGDRTITVAAIQGSVPRLGLDFNSQRKQVLDNHVAETVKLAAEVDAGRVDQPDVVIWPENASDIDPLRNADAAADITRASEAIGAPILVGTVLVNADRTTTNSVIVWDAPTVLRNSTTRRSFSRSANTCPTEASSGTSPRTPIARAISFPARQRRCPCSGGTHRCRDLLRGGVRPGVPGIGAQRCTVAGGTDQQRHFRGHRDDLSAAGNVACAGSRARPRRRCRRNQWCQRHHRSRRCGDFANRPVRAGGLVAKVPLSTSSTLASRVGPVPEIVLSIIAVGAIAMAVLARRRGQAEHSPEETAAI